MTALTTPALGPQERVVLELFHQHPLLTPQAVRMLLFPERPPEAGVRVGEQLCRRGWIDVFRTPAGLDLWLPTGAAVEAFKLDGMTETISLDWVIERVGMLHLCAGMGLRKVGGEAFRRECPELHRRGLPSNGYAADAAGKLYWLVVDHGSAVERLAVRAGKAVEKRQSLPKFRDLMAFRQFAVVIGTADLARAEEMSRAVRYLPAFHTARFHVRAIPELLPFVRDRLGKLAI
jgi:hypothetical protein